MAATDNVAASAFYDFSPLRSNQVSLKAHEDVLILKVKNEQAKIRRQNGATGYVPKLALTLKRLDGKNFGEQIVQRRQWCELMDEHRPLDPIQIQILSEPENTIVGEDSEGCSMPVFSDGRPIFLRALKDLIVKENSSVYFAPHFNSPFPTSATWRGPAVESGKALVSAEGSETRLSIENCTVEDAGPYSLLVENERGSASTVARISVARKPDVPYNFRCERTSSRSVRLSWARDQMQTVMYAIEYKTSELPHFECAATGITTPKVILRHLRATTYAFRIFAYTLHFRSDPTQRVDIDFSLDYLAYANLQNVDDFFDLGKVIGKGRFSLVFTATRKADKKKRFAAKVITRNCDESLINFEIEALQSLHHRNLCKLKGVFISKQRICFVFKWVSSINIQQHLAIMDQFTERHLQLLFTQLFHAIQYIHRNHFLHLDVKPSNILVDENRLTLIDFGSAQPIENARWTTGESAFSATERLLNGSRPTTKADVWSAGAVLCVCCFGSRPQQLASTLAKRRSAVTPQLLNLLSTLLHPNPSCRPEADDCLKDKWFTQKDSLNVISLRQQQLLSPADELKRKLRRSFSCDGSEFGDD